MENALLFASARRFCNQGFGRHELACITKSDPFAYSSRQPVADFRAIAAKASDSAASLRTFQFYQYGAIFLTLIGGRFHVTL